MDFITNKILISRYIKNTYYVIKLTDKGVERMNNRKAFLYWLLLIVVMLNKQVIVVDANGLVVNSQNYAPYSFDTYYKYLADGMEFDDYEVDVYYPPNAQGIYQFNVDNYAINNIHIYQVSSDGIYELAYFLGEDPQQDFRYHSDSVDNMKSLVFPPTLQVGQVFYQGYADQQAVTVTDILSSFDYQGEVYHNVVVTESFDETNHRTRTYLAPQVGILTVRRTSADGIFDITAGLVERSQSYNTQPSVAQNNFPLSLSSKREEVIDLFANGGISDKYSSAEAEAELARLEVLTLETGNVFKGDFVDPKYANQMNSGNISRGASFQLGDYLADYFYQYGNPAIIDNRYQFQVAFADIPRFGTWTDQTGEWIIFLGSAHGMNDNVSNIYIEILGLDTIQRTAQIQTTDTQEIKLVSYFPEGNRQVKVNTLVRPGELGGTGWYSEIQNHAYFFYNKTGGVSLAYPVGDTFVEYRLVGN